MIGGGLALGARFPRLAYSAIPSDEGESLPSLDSIRPIFKPVRIGNNGKPTRYCIDVHAHIFNASDIDAVGFIRKDVAHSIEDDLLRHFVEGLAEVVNKLSGLAFTAKQEIAKLREYLEKAWEDSKVDAVKDLLRDDAAAHRREVAEQVASLMRTIGLDKDFIRLQQAHADQMRKLLGQTSGPLEGPTTFEEEVSIAIDPARRLEQYRRKYGTDVAPSKSLDPGGYVEFIGHMLAYRWMNLMDYMHFYTEANDAFGIDALFASFVNFDYWLAPARSPQVEQMKLHALLSQMSGGYMLPIVAYNPWTDIEESDSSFKLVQAAITNYGFIGVKIYPPMGFYPYGNGSLPYPSSDKHPNLKELDRVMLRLAIWCAENNVPIMAHSGESNGRDQGGDEFGGPKGWHALLKQVAASAPSAKVVGNVAHFGGGSDAPRHPKNDWPAEFAKLMNGPPENRVFGDLAYWEQLRWCDSAHPQCAVAKSRLLAALDANRLAANRIMFGTDWDMLSQEASWARYPLQVTKNLKGVVPSMERFLYLNALECFGLGPGGAQRDRALRRLVRLPGGVPSWLTFKPKN